MKQHSIRTRPSVMLAGIFSLVLALGWQPVQAQFTLTPQAGLNLNWLTPSEDLAGITSESATYTSFGARFGYLLYDKWEFELGVLFNQRGGQWIVDNAPDVKYLIRYLDLQPQVEYKVFPRLGVYTGVYYGFHLRSDRNIDGDWEEGVDDLFAENDLGLMFGLRAYLGQIYLQAQYDYGLTAIDTFDVTDGNGNVEKTVDLQNRTLQFAVGYHFVF